MLILLRTDSELVSNVFSNERTLKEFQSRIIVNLKKLILNLIDKSLNCRIIVFVIWNVNIHALILLTCLLIGIKYTTQSSSFKNIYYSCKHFSSTGKKPIA